MSGLLIEGERQVGKSYLLHKALSNSGRSYGGYYVQRVFSRGKPYGFAIQKLTKCIPVELTVDRSAVNVERIFIYAEGERRIIEQHHFDYVAIEALKEAALQKVDFVVLDELGGVELLSEDFRATLELVLQHCNVVGTYKQDGNLSEIQRRAGISDVLLQKERQTLKSRFVQHNVRVVELTAQNNQLVEKMVLDYLD